MERESDELQEATPSISTENEVVLFNGALMALFDSYKLPYVQYIDSLVNMLMRYIRHSDSPSTCYLLTTEHLRDRCKESCAIPLISQHVEEKDLAGNQYNHSALSQDWLAVLEKHSPSLERSIACVLEVLFSYIKITDDPVRYFEVVGEMIKEQEKPHHL